MKFIFNTSHREYEVAASRHAVEVIVNRDGHPRLTELWFGIGGPSWHPAFDCEDRDDHVERTTARFCGPFFLVVTRPPRTAAMSGVPA